MSRRIHIDWMVSSATDEYEMRIAFTGVEGGPYIARRYFSGEEIAALPKDCRKAGPILQKMISKAWAK